MRKGFISFLAGLILVGMCSVAFAAQPAIPKRVMSIGSGPSGSLFINYTASWADTMMKNYPGLNIVVEPGGSSQNMQGISTGRMDFGITSSLQTYPGWYGMAWANGVKYQKIASLFPGYSYEGLFMVKAGSPIKSIQDLNGKKVSLGYAGGGSDVTGRELLDYFGVKPSALVSGSWTDVGGMLKDGLVDAVFYLAGHPAAFVQELELTHDLEFFCLTDEEFAKFQAEKPYYNIATFKAGMYKGLKQDLRVAQGWNFIACSPDLPEDFIYELTRLTWENVQAIRDAHSSFVATATENVAVGMNLPVHPGAARYYKEKGIELPVLPAPPQ